MFNPFFPKVLGGSGQGLVWEIREGDKIIDSSHPARTYEPEKPVADAYKSNASQYNTGKGQSGRDAQKLAVEAIQRGMDKIRAKRATKIEPDEHGDELTQALAKARSRRGI